jgi:hypothetical protein
MPRASDIPIGSLHPVARRDPGDQTDQESRSAGQRAAASLTVMEITIAQGGGAAFSCPA